MTITALPTPAPSTTDPTNFATRADALIAVLPTFITETNATAAAMNLNSTSDTSTTSNAIGTGAKTFTVTAGKSFQLGMYLVIADTAAPSTNSMFGQITSYSGTSLVINILTVRGSGTKTAWTISQSSAGGASAGVNSDITQLTALTSIVVSGSVAPIVVDNSTSGATKLQFKDAGISIGAIGGSVSNPFIVMNTGLTDLFHVDTAGNLVPQGKLDLSVAGQIQFPATQNASANANCLDDYEEGTWTPTGIGSTFTTATGTYTKIGNRCFVDCNIIWPVTAAASHTGFGGLPYTVGAYGGGTLGYSSEPTVFTLVTVATTATVMFYTFDGAIVLESTMSTDTIYASASFKV